MRKYFFVLISIFISILLINFSIINKCFADDFGEYIEITPKSFSFEKVDRNDKIFFSFDVKQLKVCNMLIQSKEKYLTVEGKAYIYVFTTLNESKKQTLNCEIDPKGLATGNYETKLYFSLGMYAEFELPISFYINPLPAKLSTSVNALDFGMVKDDVSEVKKVLIKNTGEEVLKTDLTVDSDWIEISDYSIFLDKNQEKTISVNLTKNPSDIRGAFTGFLTVKSNGGTKKIQVNVVFVKEVVIKLNIGSKTAYIDYKKITLDAPPEIYKSRTIVPLRFIGEAFGAEVEWEGSTNSILIYFPLKKITITLRIGYNYAEIDNNRVSLEIPPIIKNNRTLVPIRFIGEAFGANVEWNAKTQGISIILAY